MAIIVTVGGATVVGSAVGDTVNNSRSLWQPSLDHRDGCRARLPRSGADAMLNETLSPSTRWSAPTVAGTSSGGDSGLWGAPILAAGGWSDCCPRHSSADV
jgi:hypothetical protein